MRSASRLAGRRDFITRMGMLLGTGMIPGISNPTVWAASRGNREALDLEVAASSAAPDSEDSDAIGGQFDLDPRFAHLSAFVLAPHPKPVREAIEHHRRGLDRNPNLYLHQNGGRLERAVRSAAASYLGASPEEIALTDSTTMGLGLLYGGLRLRRGQEVLTTEHDFYATHEALRLRAERTRAAFRKVTLYKDLHSVSEDEIAQSIRRAIRPRTRAVAVTWVHSSTGLKLPIRRIADALAEINSRRDEEDRVLLCVDGVHGVGVEAVGVDELGCDFLVSGCHKWLFGPRGTGFIWGKRQAWPAVVATIPTFDGRSYGAWIRGARPSEALSGAAMTPGGYHSFEHRWALAEAFGLHLQIGKARVAERTHALSRQLKEGLADMSHITLITPVADHLSAGIVCFEVKGMAAEEAVSRLLRAHRVVATVTPYATRYVRFGPSILNSEEEVKRALRAVATYSLR
ncbi:MAG: aminotransferase class V-fold PLP-dependent enzyme [Actinomycetota bacterium]